MRAVFLDRDGVINQDRDDYVKSASELKIFSFAPEAIRKLTEAGFPIFVVSNQQGVAKGLISEDDLQAIESEITLAVEASSGKILRFYYCKHLASQNCSCRKPQPGLLLKAAEENGISLKDSIMIGDTERDIMAGKSAGCKTILLLTGHLTQQDAENIPCTPDFIAKDLLAATEYIIRTYL